jgi:hypothetical protein
MDNFEKQLSRLPLARPSFGLKGRIFGNMNETAARPSWLKGIFRNRVSIGWAASIAIIAGLAGALLMRSAAEPDKPMMMIPSEQTVTVQLKSDKNVFDFTRSTVESIYDDIDVAVMVDEEA